jgi:hypothetical protein
VPSNRSPDHSVRKSWRLPGAIGRLLGAPTIGRRGGARQGGGVKGEGVGDIGNKQSGIL